MAEAHPFLSLLLFAAAFAAYTGVCLKLGVAPGLRPLWLIRRSENPEGFISGLMISTILVAGILIIAAFEEWARLDSEVLTAAYLKALHDGATVSGVR
jgi:divalent metal cation (Fe/Co/Zn/Cd) transporter